MNIITDFTERGYTHNMTRPCSNTRSTKCAGKSTTECEMKEDSAVRKESRYYMDNYQATITVHTSPPHQRKQYFDYIEIDDETNDYTEGISHSQRSSKRKNLRVTFSDHIEVDVIQDLDSCDGKYEDEDDRNSIVGETLYELPMDRTKGIKQISCSAEFKSVSENIVPRYSKAQSHGAAKVIHKANVANTKCQAQHVTHNTHQLTQPLLNKRNQTPKYSLSDLEKKTKGYIAQLQEKTKRAEAHSNYARALLPDISAKVNTAQPNYKQFIANAKRAVEVTRRYERPWLSGAPGQQPFNMWKQRSETVRRTSSLPKHFKLPDNNIIASERYRRTGSDNVVSAGGERLKSRNS